ncbi:hypothetical protein LCGC14_2614600, partial [marine sediment metagenome]
YRELTSKKRGWEEFLRAQERTINYISPEVIKNDPDQFMICFSLFDIKHLLDIKPGKGMYIYSSSEAFEEESEFDFIKLNNWLKYFNFEIIGFEVVEEGGKIKPKFSEGFHASGHASKKDLRWAIETVDPDTIIPVHTDNPEWFKENFENAVLLKNGQRYP